MIIDNQLALDILESSPDATLVIDSEGHIIFSNQWVQHVFGYLPDDLRGVPVEHLLPQQFADIHRHHRQAYFKKPSIRPMGKGIDLLGQRKNGETFPAEINLSPLMTRSGMCVICAIRDVTERKAMEQDLIQARDFAQSANKSKSRFLAAASHDLRQPVQTLKLLNKTLEIYAEHAQIKKIASQQKDVIDSMAELLSSLLDISKLESGVIKPDISDVTVSEIFARMRRQFQEQADAKGLELVIEDNDHCVSSDPALLTQILQNLVANAIRYTQSGKVLLSSLMNQACVHIQVLDTGVGIPNNQLPNIFEEFTQISQIDDERRKQGFGLGLAIVERVAKILDVSVEVQSTVGKGSCFTIAVPISENYQPPKSNSVKDRSSTNLGPQSTFRILLIEDDNAVSDAMAMYLEAQGCKVDVASNLEEANVIIDRACPDVVVSDYHLRQRYNGLDAVKMIRQSLQRDIPAVFTSGDTLLALSGSPIPNSQTLRKPVDADELYDTINQLLCMEEL